MICSISGRLSRVDNGSAGILFTIRCTVIPFHSSEITVPCNRPGCLVADTVARWYMLPFLGRKCSMLFSTSIFKRQKAVNEIRNVHEWCTLVNDCRMVYVEWM